MVRNLPERHWEDGRHFRHNRDQIHSLADVFRKPSAWPGGAEATYRPLSGNLYYLAGRVLFHNRVEAYHLVDAVTYLLNGVLLLLLSRRLLPDPWSILPPLLYVSRFAHMQVVTYTSEFDALSYVTFGLLGLLCLIGEAGPRAPRARPALAAGAFGLAVLCKEAAIVWPVVAAVEGWLFRRPRAWRRYLASFVVVGVWAVAFPFILRRLYDGTRPAFEFEFRPRAVLAAYGAHLLSFLNWLVPNVDPEKAGWAMPPRVVALAESPAMILAMAVLIALLVAALLLARFRPSSLSAPMRVSALGLAWFVVATAPFAVLADRVFIRYSYAGHAGLALSVGGLAAAIAQRWRARRLDRLEGN